MTIKPPYSNSTNKPLARIVDLLPTSTVEKLYSFYLNLKGKQSK